MAWEEVGDRCYVRGYPGFDVNVGVVVGTGGALVVDTRASAAEGRELRAHLAELGVAEPAVVTTHGHFDHCLGGSVFAGPFWGHAALPAYLARDLRRTLAEEFPVWAREVAGTPAPVPDRLVSETAEIDLGDRIVELRHFGRGHTDHDLTVHVPDCGVLFAGDLVEEAGPPAYGSDCFPLDWPLTLTGLLDVRAETVVPGHGGPVGAAFVAAQRDAVAAVALAVRDAHDAGQEPLDALRTGVWPYDPVVLAHAVHRGFHQLAGPG